MADSTRGACEGLKYSAEAQLTVPRGSDARVVGRASGLRHRRGRQSRSHILYIHDTHVWGLNTIEKALKIEWKSFKFVKGFVKDCAKTARALEVSLSAPLFATPCPTLPTLRGTSH